MTTPKHKILIKGEFSGIQNYIFNIQSEGAAKELRKRSLHIADKNQAYADHLCKSLNLNCEHLAAGNFILIGDATSGLEEEFFKIRKEIYKAHAKAPFKIFLSHLFVKEKELSENYHQAISNLSQKTNAEKLHFGKNNAYNEIFEPYYHQPPEMSASNPEDCIPVFENIKQTVLIDEVKNKGTIDFDDLARFAELRTGSSYLASLKLDLDNLGKKFFSLTDPESNKHLSQQLHFFFEDPDGTLKQLIKNGSWQGMDGKKHYFSDNLYLVFAGGDDTFILGGYDALWEFTATLYSKFNEFAQNLKKDFPHLNLTFSASYNIFHSKFPVVKIAGKAEETLDEAKNYTYATEELPQKNKISILGQVFTWKEFMRLGEISYQLTRLIQNGESKTLLNRIRLSYKGFQSAEKDFSQGKLTMQKVWNLFYFIRNVKKQNADKVEQLMKEYENMILDDYLESKKSNPMLFPVAARLAELYTRNTT